MVSFDLVCLLKHWIFSPILIYCPGSDSNSALFDLDSDPLIVGEHSFLKNRLEIPPK